MRLLCLSIIFITLLLKCSCEEDVASCTPGTFWVNDYIKYNCYEDGNTKGIAVVGCAPSNDMIGEVLLPWQTHTTCHFKYVCELNATHAAYKVKTCMDRTGAVLKVGMTRTFDDGEAISCVLEGSKIRAKVVSKFGCVVDEQVYGEKQTWLVEQADNVEVSGRTVTVGRGISYQCSKYENGTYYRSIQACLTSDNRYIRPDSFGMVDGVVVKCSIGVKSTVYQLIIANSQEISCRLNSSTTLKHGDQWTSDKGNSLFICNFGVAMKKSCMVNGEEVPINSVRYMGGLAYYCHQGNGIFSFGDIKGCTSSTGRPTRFDQTTIDGDMVMKCSFDFTSYNTVVASFHQVGCFYKKEEITINAMQIIDGQYIYCAKESTGTYKARSLTAVEIQQWMSRTAESHSRVLDGVEGNGSGAELTRATTTTTTTTTTRPPTTSAPPTTKRPPTTTTTTTKRPPTTSTRPITTMSTTTTTTNKPPTTKATGTVKPIVTPQPMKESNCIDLLSNAVCSQLTPLCYTTSGKIKEIKRILKEAKVNQTAQNRASVILEALGSGPRSADEIFDRVFGSSIDSLEDANNCRCSSCCDDCNECRCRSESRLLRRLVLHSCAKTCGCDINQN